MEDNKFILLTVDVEDWFHVENFKKWIPFDTWPSRDLRVEKNTHDLLDLFDRFAPTQKPEIVTQSPEPGPKNSIKATFFVLGWIAEQLPHLVREIHARGHEVASHGYNHNLSTEFSLEAFRTDLLKSKELLEDIIGGPVFGYRAPSFGINKDVLKVIQDCGYLYDSSYNSFALHGRYGKLSFNGAMKKGISINISETFFELPISNISLESSELMVSKKRGIYDRLIVPWGGGAYFRLIPFLLFKAGVKNILKKEDAYLMYLHPWEIDPEQPRVEKATLNYKFRHYINLNSTMNKLVRLIDTFSECDFITCKYYLESRRLRS
jgi:peptidoglycan-N-acetylglucosamine deacetylase